MSFVRVPPDSTGKKVDTIQMTDGSDIVERQTIALGDGENVTQFAEVDALKRLRVYDDVIFGLLNALISNTDPDQTSKFIPIRAVPMKYIDVSFAREQANGVHVDTGFALLQNGAGQTVNQTGGNLVITSGTTANSETILRHSTPIRGAFTFKNQFARSAVGVNNNLYFELVDIIGDGLAATVLSTTQVRVTIPSNPFSDNSYIGQRVDIGRIAGFAGIPMEGVIAAISGNDVTFTVAGYPASGSGTVSLCGWNKYEINYGGAASNTTTLVNTRRRGRQNTAAAATTNSQSATHMICLNQENGVCSVADQLATFAGVLSPRGAWVSNIPLPEENLFLQIRSKNGTAAATASTYTIGFVRIEDYIPFQTSLVSDRSASLNVAAKTTQPVSFSQPSLIAGAALIGDTSAQYRAGNAGAGTITKIIAAATTNPTIIKASAGKVIGWQLHNTSTTPIYLKFHNIATTPVAGTTAVAFTVGIPAGNRSEISFEGGIGFATGIGMTITANPADNDTAAVAVNSLIGNLVFA